MYYIFIYCEFTLMIPLIDKLSKSKYKYLGFLLSPIEIICMRLIPLISGYEVNKYIEGLLSISCLGWFTYFYLGYLIGNNLLKVKLATKKMIFLWLIAIVLQIIEGYWYFSMGETNCGTQLKLSSILTGTIFVMLAYRCINSGKLLKSKILCLLGDSSFGIYFSHLAVMAILSKLPFYSQYVIYPINAIIAILSSLVFVLIGKKVLGRYGKYFAL